MAPQKASSDPETVDTENSPPCNLRDSRKALEELWRQGMSGRILLDEHTRLTDQFISHCSGSLAVTDGIALVALGGYGREELFPFSDIDLMLLHEPGHKEQVEAVVNAVFYPLWDAGLEIGHSVRTVKESLTAAEEDFHFWVALLDARLISGSKKLFNRLIKTFRDKFVEGRRREFLKKMLTAREARHEKFGRHSYHLEPHIKEGLGGLRDIQSLFWTAKAVFGLKNLGDIENAGLLSREERLKFEEAWNNLTRIRNRLHYISGLKNDQLFFEHQEEMAKAFGYQSAGPFLDVEQFMRDVYAHMQAIAVTVNLFFEHVSETLGLSSTTINDKILEPGIEILNDKILLTDLDRLHKKTNLLFRIFFWAAKTGFAIHHRTRKQIVDNLRLIDAKFKKSRRNSLVFLDILQTSQNPLPVLAAMLETGLLGAYIPEFARLDSLAQHDIYHVYTVDRHLLQTLSELSKLREEATTIYQGVSSPGILFLAALLHDIGKGNQDTGRNHSERGSDIVGEIARRLGLHKKEQEDLIFLVQNHLFMTDTALRRDLEDETLIARCARHISNSDRLAMLYLLSVADARATGPSAWNDWKAALLLELYFKIGLLLEKDSLSKPNRNQAVDWTRKKVKKLLGKDCDFDLKILPEDYLLSFSPEEIAYHINRGQEKDLQEIIIYPDIKEGCWTLLILTRDQPGLLSRICGVLTLHNLDVLAAQIFTWQDGTVVDILDVNSAVGELYSGQDWQTLEADLKKTIRQKLGLAHRLYRKPKPLGRKSGPTGRKKAKVLIDNDISDEYSLIEVFAGDRDGLLYELTRTMSEMGINIFRAKIENQAGKVIDAFYVLDGDGNKLEDQAVQEELRQSLLFVIPATPRA